jgi:hypothetical protein
MSIEEAYEDDKRGACKAKGACQGVRLLQLVAKLGTPPKFSLDAPKTRTLSALDNYLFRVRGHFIEGNGEIMIDVGC